MVNNFLENFGSSFTLEKEKIYTKITNLVPVELTSLHDATHIPVKKYKFLSNVTHAKSGTYGNEVGASTLIESEEMQKVGQIETSLLIPKEKATSSTFNEEELKATLSFAIYNKMYSQLILGNSELNIQGFLNIKNASVLSNHTLKDKADLEKMIAAMRGLAVTHNADPFDTTAPGIVLIPHKYDAILNSRAVDSQTITVEQDLSVRYKVVFIQDIGINTLVLYQDRSFRSNLRLVLDREIKYWSVPEKEGLYITAFARTTGLTIAHEREIVRCTPKG